MFTHSAISLAIISHGVVCANAMGVKPFTVGSPEVNPWFAHCEASLWNDPVWAKRFPKDVKRVRELVPIRKQNRWPQFNGTVLRFLFLWHTYMSNFVQVCPSTRHLCAQRALCGIPGTCQWHSYHDHLTITQVEPLSVAAYFEAIQRARPNDIVMDIGANVGFYTTLAARFAPSVRVISVDMQPRCVDLIQCHLAGNDVPYHSSRVRVLNRYVAATEAAPPISVPVRARSGRSPDVVSREVDARVVENHLSFFLYFRAARRGGNWFWHLELACPSSGFCTPLHLQRLLSYQWYGLRYVPVVT